MKYATKKNRLQAGEVDAEFVAEVEQRCATAIALARTGAIRGSLVLHLLDDGSLYAYSFGEMPADLRSLAAELRRLS